MVPTSLAQKTIVIRTRQRLKISRFCSSKFNKLALFRQGLHIWEVYGIPQLSLLNITWNAYLVMQILHLRIFTLSWHKWKQPLAPMSNDLLSLTSEHFLITEPLTAILEDDVMYMPSNRLSHYKWLQQFFQHFWSRWWNEYVISANNVAIGIKVSALVTLGDENLPSPQWKMGRIVESFSGQDNIVRVVSVKTLSGIVKRATATNIYRNRTFAVSFLSIRFIVTIYVIIVNIFCSSFKD